MNTFKLAFFINPIAGIGGSVALKGSDGSDTPAKALALGATPKAHLRSAQALTVLLPYKDKLVIYTASGCMGEDTAKALGFEVEVVYQCQTSTTTARDTEQFVQVIKDINADILLFAGGDGTARNVYDKLGHFIPVLGIPAGCKIHSGVYALTPSAAGRVVELMLNNELVSFIDADVMDIDEVAFRQGVVKARRYGEMQIPSQIQYIQAVKSGGKESDELVLMDLAAHVIELMDEEIFVMGSGSTVAAVMEEMTIKNTLLGVDVIRDHTVLANDITEPKLFDMLSNAKHHNNDKFKLVITVIGGQGHILGRGNQQLSPRVIRLIGKENIIIIATKRKLHALNKRPLIVDTGDQQLNAELSGFIPVVTGFHDQVLYPVASPH